MKTLKLSVLMSAVLITVDGIEPASGQDRTLRENPELAAFFEDEVSRLEQQNDLTRFKSLAEWQDAKPQLREQLFDMLGLSPRPEITPLQATTTGTTEEEEFVVERVHFQSMPGLYVTGNFYRPKTFEGPLPTVLYVCGHGKVVKDGVSFGNKTHYHYHGCWFARNGYACLTIDTLQLGEIEGVHHGTYNMNRLWWNSRGYTPAGVEAWNCIRALDYLETRAEVDAERIGVTGRSGGGAYSWWIAALDDRIKCAVPVAGITSMRDHVIVGCVEGHCDCMYMLNTFRWDYATVAALVAPRPLLISNTDKDTIFPLEGVVDIHRQVRHIYQLHDAENKLGLQITEGPHEDTQELHIHAFRWFNRFLKNDTSMIEKTAVKFFEPEQLKVFTQLPTDEINTSIDESFVPLAPLPASAELLQDQEAFRERMLSQLKDRCFRAWPGEEANAAEAAQVDVTLQPSTGAAQVVTRLSFETQPHVLQTVDISHAEGASLQELELLEQVVELSSDADESKIEVEKTDAQAVMVPRPGGLHPWLGNDAKQTQIQRRFQLLGMTVDGMRIWDIRRSIQVIRQQCPRLTKFRLKARSGAESLVLLAALFEPGVTEIIVPDIARTRDEQPSIINLTRTISTELLPILAAMKADVITTSTTEDAAFAAAVTQNAAWTGKKLSFSTSASGSR